MNGIETHYTPEQVGKLCGGRGSVWAIRKARAGEFGRVVCDSGGWLIPESGVNSYLSRNTPAGIVPARFFQNLGGVS